jgi:hypothetical protein
MARPKKTNPQRDKDILAAALLGLEAEKQQIEARMAEIRARLRGTAAPSESSEPRRAMRTLNAEARHRIAAAQKKRWAAFRKSAAAKKPKKTGTSGTGPRFSKEAEAE